MAVAQGPVRRWIEGRGKPLNVQRQKRRRITERLASRVKGLTARFDVLLLTLPALQSDGPAARDGAHQELKTMAKAWIPLTAPVHRISTKPKPGW